MAGDNNIGDNIREKVLQIIERLPPEVQRSALDYLEHLAEKYGSNEEESLKSQMQTPKDIARPREESVVAAIKRLKSTYPMLDSQTLMNPVSTLMTNHLMKGEAAEGVIDQLELLFEERYLEYKNGF